MKIFSFTMYNNLLLFSVNKRLELLWAYIIYVYSRKSWKRIHNPKDYAKLVIEFVK